jgi:hypothetical protein
MPRKRHSAEEIVAKLHQADVLLAQGQMGADVARVLGTKQLRNELLGSVVGAGQGAAFTCSS